MPHKNLNRNGNLALQALLAIGLASGFMSEAILNGVTLVIAIAGVVIIRRRLLSNTGWEVPRELRLIHFAFWLYPAVSLLLWATSGFGYDGLETFATSARLILFWPLLIAVVYGGIRATGLFTVVTISTLICACVLSFTVESHWGDAPMLLHRGKLAGAGGDTALANLALLLGSLCVVAGFCFNGEKRRIACGAAAFAAVWMLAITIFVPITSNLIAVPVLLACLLPLAPGRLRFAGLAIIVAIALVIAFVSDWNAHKLLGSLTSRGLLDSVVELLLTLLPAAIFLRHIFEKHQRSSHIAVAGLMVSVASLVFTLTNTALNNSAFLTGYLLLIVSLAGALFAELSDSYRLNRRVKVSATVITKDEADNIADCLQSARQVADEIIVLDSGSCDDTVAIAKRYADIVEITDWPGFGIQKQRALEKATGKWVLSIDADERITPELAREINHHLSDPHADAYKLPWAVTLYGKRLDFGRSGRAPLRLFRREGVRFSEAMVHEKILIPEGRKTSTLRGRLTHYTHRDFGHALEKSAHYAWLGSQEKHRRGKRTRTLLYPTFRGVLTFIQVYLIRLGVLDGSVGFLVAVTYAQGSFNKYAGLWTLTRSGEKRAADERQ